MDDVRHSFRAEATEADPAAGAWQDALVAARVLRLAGPLIGGLRLKARAGGVRDSYLAHLFGLLPAGTPQVRLPPPVSTASLSAALDLQATVLAGRFMALPSPLARADGGLLLLPMAERLDTAAAALIGDTLDRGSCPADPRLGAGASRAASRFTLVALDEGAEPEECPPAALTDRLGLTVDLGAIPWRTALVPAPAPERLPAATGAAALQEVVLETDLLRLLSAVTVAAGVPSLRRLHQLTVICRSLALLDGRRTATEADALTALRLCLGLAPAPREAAGDDSLPEEAMRPNEAPDESADDALAPDQPPRADTPPGPEDTRQPPDDPSALTGQLADLVTAIEAGQIDLPPDFGRQSGRAAASRQAGTAGVARKDARRGRPVALRRSPPYPSARPSLIDTLRAAAPWQPIRARNRQALLARAAAVAPAAGNGTRNAIGVRAPSPAPAALITRDDFRYRSLRHETPSTAIFLVDASGSTALARLGETKGAIEQLLARCYVRRDEVAMIAFRGTTAETVLAPTRSLVMAKRKLAGLPGGGATPLVCGLEKGLELALSVRRQGSTPLVVLLTDGRGNIARDGSPDRALAGNQLVAIATRYRSQNLHSLCIDIGSRPREAVATLAETMGADLHFLRHADTRIVSDLVNAHLVRSHQHGEARS
ncbi:VWA domain-containing protein [Pannonibacter tanglangensis]|uniref:VWA domain-containing protein n=1 Tax=Pannonibacter tanglangensis TaxID=2750084 RepID=A0ABW9ZE99_9HYPH|nr:VWA domain-containing protein [Pannonibacter sp. XCT-34]NBN63139.1 VWA domain-containing protein [Pannonibacter sp. XCT-34]